MHAWLRSAGPPIICCLLFRYALPEEGRGDSTRVLLLVLVGWLFFQIVLGLTARFGRGVPDRR